MIHVSRWVVSAGPELDACPAGRHDEAMSEPRRRRRGSSRPAGPPAAAAVPPEQPLPRKKPAGRTAKAGNASARDSERGWRDLAGNSPSQVGLSAAMRARDIARPNAEQLAAAERTVVVVRREWQPPT